MSLFDVSEYMNDPQVVNISGLINSVEALLKSNDITEAEYADLMSDIEGLRTIIALKNNLELNQKIHDAIVTLIELAKMLKP